MTVLQCDEHIRYSLWKALKSIGLEVRSIEEENLKGTSDYELLQFCLKHNRILLTNDKDFFPLAKDNEHAGIMYITNQQAPLDLIRRKILFLCFTLKEEELYNSVFYVP